MHSNIHDQFYIFYTFYYKHREELNVDTNTQIHLFALVTQCAVQYLRYILQFTIYNTFNTSKTMSQKYSSVF